MDTLLARLERRFGRYAIEGLVTYLAFASAAAAVLCFMQQGFADGMALDPFEVRHGQWWRLLSFMLAPRRNIYGKPWNLLMHLVFGVGFLVWISQAIESAWGAFRMNAFVLIGWLLTAIAAMVTGAPTSNYYLIGAITMVGGTLFPAFEVNLYGIIPLSMKWIALITFAGMALFGLRGGPGDLVSFGVSIGVYALFCAGTLRGHTRRGSTDWTKVQRTATRASAPPPSAAPKRACATCGLTDEDEGADLRVCTCKEVCGGKPTVYCLAHAKSHRVATG